MTVEVGTEQFAAAARILAGEERDQVFERQKEIAPVFRDHEAATDRVIPVIALDRPSARLTGR